MMKNNNTLFIPSQQGKLSTLIVGAGIAGLTLAALLRQRGEHPVVIEKQAAEDFNTSGYMLGLLPLGARVLNTLGLKETYLQESVPVHQYYAYDGRGKLINQYDMQTIIKEYGEYQGISRVALVKILQHALDGLPIHYDTSVRKMQQQDDQVEITFSDGSTQNFHVVVLADGLHSSSRKLLLKKAEYKYFQTGWGGWVTTISPQPSLTDRYVERWGKGTFLGMYPVKEGIGVFWGGENKYVRFLGHQALADSFREVLRKLFSDAEHIIESLKTEKPPYYWDLHDCRSKTWHKGNIVLLGDAATGFLPTAGVGASMAMSSAAALNDELSRADPSHINYALRLYEHRQKNAVEKAQRNSRNLGRLMFTKNAVASTLRNRIFSFLTLDMALSDIRKVLEGN